MKSRLFLFTFMLVGSYSLLAGNDNLPIGARSAALSNASVTLSDAWSAHHNQAGLGFLTKATAGVYYESRFLLPELALSGAVVALPLANKKGTFGFSYRNFGYKLYSESKAGLSYSRAFGEDLSFGTQINYQQIRIGDAYGNRNVLTFEMGVQYRVAKSLMLGAHVFNPNRTKLTEINQDRLPAVIRLGLRYNFSKNLFLSVETEKDTYNPAVFRAGLEYMAGSVLFLRAGFGTNPFSSAFGFGLLLKNLKVDFAGSFHPVLGFTPQASLTYDFARKSS
jgi:hypothetical protein